MAKGSWDKIFWVSIEAAGEQAGESRGAFCTNGTFSASNQYQAFLILPPPIRLIGRWKCELQLGLTCERTLKDKDFQMKYS
jgi:hypothetical protein